MNFQSLAELENFVQTEAEKRIKQLDTGAVTPEPKKVDIQNGEIVSKI